MKSFTYILFVTFGLIAVSVATTSSTLSYDNFQNVDIAAEAIPNGETDLVALADENAELKAIDFELEENTVNHQTTSMSETSNKKVNPTINLKIPVVNRPLITKKVTVADMADFNQAKTLEKWLESKTASIMQEKASEPTETTEMEPEMSEEPTLYTSSRLSFIQSKIRDTIQRLSNRNSQEARAWLDSQDEWLREEVLQPAPTDTESIDEDIIEPSAEAELTASEISTSSRQVDESEEAKRNVISWIDSEPAEEVPEDEIEPSAEMELELASTNRAKLIKESIRKHEQLLKLLQNRENLGEPKIPTIVRDGQYDEIAQWLDSQDKVDEVVEEEEPEMSVEPTAVQMIPNTVRDGQYDEIAQWLDSQDKVNEVVEEEEPEMSIEPTVAPVV